MNLDSSKKAWNSNLTKINLIGAATTSWITIDLKYAWDLESTASNIQNISVAIVNEK